MSKVFVFDAPAGLYNVVADHVTRLAQEAVAERGRFLLCLSGGNTPRPLYKQLALPPWREQMPWRACHILWGDERLVPPDDRESNYRLAQVALLAQVPIPAGNIYRMRGELEPEAAVADYTQQLAALTEPGQPWPRLDLALMGIGSDGHTASLFPGSSEPSGVAVIATVANDPKRPAQRITLTSAMLNSSREVIFLVRGEEKAEPLATILQGDQDPLRWPAQRIRPESGRLVWYVDQPAASRLDLSLINE